MTEDIHVSTKDTPGDYDAIETAKPGEPLFPLQGGDQLAPRTVQFWADFARATAHAILQGAKVRVGLTQFETVDARDDYEPTEADKRLADKLLRKATSAEQVGWVMQAYQRGDIEQNAYVDDTLAEQLEVDAADRAAQRKARIAMASALNNAVGISFEVAEGLSKLRVLPMTEAKIREAVEALKEAAEEVEPRRGMERS